VPSRFSNYLTDKRLPDKSPPFVKTLKAQKGGNHKANSHRQARDDEGLGTASVPAGSMIYWPYPQFPGVFNHLVVRTAGDPFSVVAGIKAQVRSVNPEQPVSEIRTMEQVLGESLARRKFSLILTGIFAGVALVLAAMGVAGVMAFMVAADAGNGDPHGVGGAEERRVWSGAGARIAVDGAWRGDRAGRGAWRDAGAVEYAFWSGARRPAYVLAGVGALDRCGACCVLCSDARGDTCGSDGRLAVRIAGACVANYTQVASLGSLAS